MLFSNRNEFLCDSSRIEPIPPNIRNDIVSESGMNRSSSRLENHPPPPLRIEKIQFVSILAIHGLCGIGEICQEIFFTKSEGEDSVAPWVLQSKVWVSTRCFLLATLHSSCRINSTLILELMPRSMYGFFFIAIVSRMFSSA